MAWGILLLAALPSRAEEKTAAKILPETTIAYVEFPAPSDLIETLLRHPLRHWVEEQPEYRQATGSKEYLMFQGILDYVESRIGMDWQAAIAALTDQGVSVGIDSETEGVAILVHARDAETLKKLVEEFHHLAKEDAHRKEKPEPYEIGEYRGVTVYKTGPGGHAVIEDWLLLTNNGELGKAMIDNLLEASPTQTLADSHSYQQAQTTKPKDATLWGWVDIHQLRTLSEEHGKPYVTQTDHPLAELLVGGLLDVAQKTSHATGALFIEKGGARLELSVPHSSDWVSQPRDYYFGPNSSGRAPALIDVPDTLFHLSTYRNLSGMWLWSGDLFNEEINDQFAEADSTLTTLFSGKDFGEEILGAFGPQLQIVVARQTFEEGTPKPEIRLPSFGILFTMKDPHTTRVEMRRIFQSLIGFLNIVGAMEGKPQLDLFTEKKGDIEYVGARFLAEQDAAGDDNVPFQFNFSPCVAFSDQRFVLASTRELAEQMAQGQPTAPASESANTMMRLDMTQLNAVLQENRDQLIAQNMLEEGHSRQQAEQEIDRLFSILDLFEEVALQLDVTDEISLTLQAALKDEAFTQPKSGE